MSNIISKPVDRQLHKQQEYKQIMLFSVYVIIHVNFIVKHHLVEVSCNKLLQIALLMGP